MSRFSPSQSAGPAAAALYPLGVRPRSLFRRYNSRSRSRSERISPTVVSGTLRIAEFLISSISGLLIALWYLDDPGIAADFGYLGSCAFVGVATVTTLGLMGLHRARTFNSFVRHVPELLIGWTSAFALCGGAIFFFKAGADFSRTWLLLWFAAGGCLLLTGRATLAAFTREWARQGRLFRRAVIYGVSGVTEELIAELEADPESDLRITGIFDDREDGRVQGGIAGYPRLGDLEDLVRLSRTTRIDLVIVALPVAGEARLAHVVKQLSVLPADIKMPARATAVRFAPRTYSHVGTVAMIDLYENPITGWSTVAKWVFDKTIGFTALILLAPVMAAIAAAIRLDSGGPVFFRQKRYGFNNELIEVFKFRSMYSDRCDAAAGKLVTRDDPRVTPVGHLIRRTSLDELPQLFNVMMGNLSLVGPRPHAVQAKAGRQLYQEAVDGYFARHKVKPGITGWAQINGWRGETDTAQKIQKRVAHDLYYIENWSLFFDLYILFKTPLSLIRGENAY